MKFLFDKYLSIFTKMGVQMKSYLRIAMAFICMLILAGSFARAQDLQQQLSKLGSNAAVGYATPLLSGIGTI